METEVEDNVIVLPVRGNPETTRDTFTSVKRDGPICGHRSTVVDANARRVECKSCGAELCAFDVLLMLANDCERRTRDWQKLKEATEVLRSDVKTLRRLRDNARQGVKRATGKLPDQTGWGLDHITAPKVRVATIRREVILASSEWDTRLNAAEAHGLSVELNGAAQKIWNKQRG